MNTKRRGVDTEASSALSLLGRSPSQHTPDLLSIFPLGAHTRARWCRLRNVKHLCVQLLAGLIPLTRGLSAQARAETEPRRHRKNCRNVTGCNITAPEYIRVDMCK